MTFKSRIGFGLLFILLSVSLAYAALVDRPYHMDRKNLPIGCASCHLGFDFSRGGGPRKCTVCHGSDKTRPRGIVSGDSNLKDISKEFEKNYRHPTFDVAGVHNAREVLPETDPSIPRHADCSDCHNAHYISKNNRYAGIKGKKVGNLLSNITKEFELCYLCHAESANLPVKSTNKRVEFNITNASFHPVEGEGKNLSVPSLIRPYREKKVDPGDVSIIKCADCHGSDDPRAPQGPHGSKYQGLLIENYATSDGTNIGSFENTQSYALCYRCHKHTSIMGNESFPQHSQHVAGEGKNKLKGGTSCKTCHSSHGSIENRYLIRFNRDFVTESSTGKLKFVEKGTNTRHGECWLTCHSVDHNPKSY